MISFAPLTPPDRSKFEEMGVEEMIRSLFDNGSVFAACSPMEGRFLSTAVLYRGVMDDKPLADAAHTQVQTVRQTLYEQSGDYMLTVKKNQKDLYETLATLFTEQRFSPSTHPADPRPEPGEQPGTTRNPSLRLPGSDSAEGGLPRGPDRRAAAAAGPAQG